MLRCKELTELVTDHLELQLPASQSAGVSFHLISCQHCRAYLGQMKSMLRLLRQLPADPGPPTVSDELLRAFRRRQRVHQIKRSRRAHRPTSA